MTEDYSQILVTDDDAGGFDDRVTVSVLHGSFDCAGYPLMIGVYSDEEMTGAERFLDRQFDQLLSGWQDLGHYPGPLGTSVFVKPGGDVPEGCEPVGAYLVGLGSSLALGPRQLRAAVYRALVARCLRLYRPGGGKDPKGTTEARSVGVSTAILGVRDDQGLRIEEAVTAILEGVQDGNNRLAEYEQEREIRSPVRVGALQFVERHAHRADLAARAVRHAGSRAALRDSFSGLEDVWVSSGDGALPAGAALLEQDRSWLRFAVLERDTRSGSSTVEVTTLGRDARSDRAIHQIDRASLDELTARLSTRRDDHEALKALRDRLIPYDMRAEFLASAAVQLVLDERTANYSWEQFAAPDPDVSDTDRAAAAGSILRIFTETTDQRLQPVRARVGTALVIGAGNTTAGSRLPGAVKEAKAIHDLFVRRQIESTVMVDDPRSLSVAKLNIELLGDHQILHLAGHGSHVEGAPQASGVHLADGFLFTAQFVDSMPVVPELVVLNSCYNATIDETVGLNRLAAGLARTLMRIGVRAVVAAGWPIGDAAAKAFAETFYDDMLQGRTFGDAVRHARQAAAEHKGTTWAAYQCYGDPTFVLRGQTAGLDRIGAPVSLTDLRTRIETLIVQIADLSRPRPGARTDRRDQLVERFRQLDEWAAEHEATKPAEIRELLARAARELGEFDRAAHWYTTFAKTHDQARRPAQPTASAHHLQQAANCTARGAQNRQRDAGGWATTEALDAFAEAEALAKGARTALNDDEGAAILASVYKKWATAVPPGPDREERLRKAVDTYGQIESRVRGTYGVENWIQVVALRDRDRAAGQLTELTEPPPDGQPTALPLDTTRPLIDAAPPRGPDFWARVAPGDRALTVLMTAGTTASQRAAAEDLVEIYLGAFDRRSTFAERYSSIDHLKDLYDLMPDDDSKPDDDRKRLLGDALDRLARWRRFTPQETTPEPESTTGVSVTRTAGRGPATVKLTAVHASCGDCLLLDYTGNDGTGHRILVDGGLGSAFDEGLGRVLGPPGSPMEVDVAVVTHVDGDHIAGVIRALEDNQLAAKDFWFNGRDQLTEPDQTESTRSTKQGDALSRLIPDGTRNRIVDGRALVVGDSGPPTHELPGGATVALLSPSRARLDKLLARWPETTRGGDDLEALLAAFDGDLDEDLDGDLERGRGVVGRDRSVSNGSSLAFLFEHDGASILFTGDAWASELVSSITALLKQHNDANPGGDALTALPVQVFKVSHHGSRQNLTDKLLALIEPEQILICTDGSKFEHPDEDALDMLVDHYPGVPIHFTDATEVIRERAGRLGLSLPRTSPVMIEL